MRPSSWIAPREAVLGQFERRNDLARLRDLVRRRREDRVAGVDVARMDQRLAVEAEIAALRAFGGKAVEIADIAVGPVEHFEPVRMRRQHAMRDHRDHRRAARHHPDPRFPRDVVRSEHEAGKPRFGIARRGGELVGIEHRARGLDHGPDPDGSRCAERAQARADLVELVYRGNLRHQDAVRLDRARHRRIVGPPGGVEAVGADQYLALAETPGLHGLRDLLARLRLGVGRNRILEIKDQAVCREIARLFQRPCIRSGHEEQAAARADHGRFLTFFRSGDIISTEPLKALFRSSPCD